MRRRFARYLDERIDTGEEADDTADDEGDPAAVPQRPSPVDPETGRPRKFAYPPNLLVVDGGAPQVAAAAAALAELGIDDVAVCGLAKRLEEVWLPGEDDPVILPRTSEALYLLQRVRDEAHRFAITYHRQKRSRAMTVSALDDVPGLGETRRKALLTQALRLAEAAAARPSVEEIMAVPGRRRGGPRRRSPAGAAPGTDAAAGSRATWTADVTGATVLDGVRPGARGRRRHRAVRSRPQHRRQVLEDLGWFVVDNLPPALIAPMVDLGSRTPGEVTRLAVVVDVRSRAFSGDLRSVIARARDAGHRPRVLFLEASDDVLVRRYETNRRDAPAAGRAAGWSTASPPSGSCCAGIAREADLWVDTSRRCPCTSCARRSRTRSRGDGAAPAAAGHRAVASASSTACRWTPTWWSTSGSCPTRTGSRSCARTPARTRTSATTCSARRAPTEFLDRYTELLRLIGAGYRREGKRYLTLAVGCTGGKHRSVAIAEELAGGWPGDGVQTRRSRTGTWAASE